MDVDLANRISGMPEAGTSWDELSAIMSESRTQDARWRDGRTFGMVYPSRPDVTDVAKRAYAEFFTENGFQPKAFPSLVRFEREIIAMAADLFQAPAAIGTLTSGGTESIFLAVKAARDEARARRGVVDAEVVVPWTGYPAFAKVAHYLNIRLIRTFVGEDFRANLEAVKDAITSRTVLIVGSAPGFAHGVVDPIEEMADIAQSRGINFHVDASVGGFQLPFLRKLGVDSPDFDFRIPGVTSLNADLHKFGYCALGTGVILYRTEAAHDFQPFHLDDWAMGPWHSPAMLGTRPGAAIAASWAVMRYLGNAGYIELTRTVWRTAERLMQGINLIPGLQVWGTPHMACFAYGSRIVDIHDVADEMIAKGWFVRKQAYPPSIHVVLTPPHEAVVDAYLSDLSDAVDKATR